MLTVEALKVHGLAPVSFQVAGGEALGLMGPSGAGKTLLLRAIADLDPREQGDIAVNGIGVDDVSGPVWRAMVRYAASEPGWWAGGARDHFTQAQEAADRITALGLPPAILDRRIERLSTGERQRLALVRALADAPAVALFDEPTAALDADARERAEAMIAAELARGMSAVIVTHDREQAARLAARVLHIEGVQVRSETL